MPVEPTWFDRASILTYEEILRVVRVFCARGGRKVRLTGGEPLVRRDLATLIGLLSQQTALEDISLTTNGVLLAEAAPDLAAAGLRRLNVSLDTLSASRFQEMTRRDELARVLAGLAAAALCGFDSIKINTVLVRGKNDDEVEALVAWSRECNFEIRFIEYMPLENGATWDLSRVVAGAEVRRRIEALWPIEPVEGANPHAPAKRWRFVDTGTPLGFIDSVTQPFCGNCSRLRLTSDGKFRVCLYDDREAELREPMREGAGDDEIERRMERALAGKGRGGALEIFERQAALPLVRTMHQIGG